MHTGHSTFVFIYHLVAARTPESSADECCSHVFGYMACFAACPGVRRACCRLGSHSGGMGADSQAMEEIGISVF